MDDTFTLYDIRVTTAACAEGSLGARSSSSAHGHGPYIGTEITT